MVNLPQLYSTNAQRIMRRNPVGFALAVGMALIVVLFGFTLLSAFELAGFSAAEAEAAALAASDTTNVREAVGPTCGNMLAGPEPVATAEVAAGELLFRGNCAQCHAVNEQVVGPALAGISMRRPISWILPWVKNSSKLVASGDEYAVALFNKFNKQQMPSFALSDKEITSIIAYIDSQQGRAWCATALLRSSNNAEVPR
jgi:mono/diheme cytochrome c family protein